MALRRLTMWSITGGETGLDFDFSVTGMVLPSDVKYLALAFHMKAE